MQAIEPRYYTPEEYLQLEEQAEFKSEYIDGLIIPMAGGTTNHNRVAGNLYARLNFTFRQQNYEVFIGDVRLWIPRQRTYTYPDVMVIKGEVEYHNQRQDIVTNPTLIVEVLSPSTQSHDRTDKFTAYRTIPSFQEYLLIDQTQMLVQQWSIMGKKQATVRDYDEADETIVFSSIPCEISLAELYSKVNFAEVEQDAEESP